MNKEKYDIKMISIIILFAICISLMIAGLFTMKEETKTEKCINDHGQVILDSNCEKTYNYVFESDITLEEFFGTIILTSVVGALAIVAI